MAQQVPGDPYRFRTAIQYIAPPWLQGEWGGKFLYAIGTVVDGIAEAAREGVRARLPGAGSDAAPPDALSYIGHDRGIVRGWTESDTAYSARLRTSMLAWRTAAGPRAVLNIVRGLFSPDVIDGFWIGAGGSLTTGVNTWLTRVGNVETWLFNGADTWTWRAPANLPSDSWLVLFPPVSWTRATWGSGKAWGDDAWSWGANVPGSYGSTIRRAVRQWKGASTRYVSILVTFDPTWPDPAGSGAGYPDASWANYSAEVAGVQVATRNPVAIYMGAVT